MVSGVTVGAGFLFHELSHKVIAQKYGAIAEFRSFDEMLFLAIIMSFFGFVIAAPGAVVIFSRVLDIKKNGIISVAGPIMNIFIALAFLLLGFIITGNLELFSLPIPEVLELNLGLAIIAIGFLVNSWLALFNMIPLWLFDGAKVFRWNKIIWFLVVFIAAFLVFGI